MQAIYVGTLTGIGPGIEQPPSRLFAESQAKVLPRMRCPPSGSFWLDGSSSGSSSGSPSGSPSGRSAEDSRRAPCSWDIGGNCVSGAGNLIIEIADGNYQRLLDTVPCMDGTQREPCLCSFPSFLPLDHVVVMALATAQAWSTGMEYTARLTAGTGPKACRLPKASHRDSSATF